MPFITQGKTNIKYILIVVVSAAIAGGGIFAYQYWWVPKHETKMPEIKPFQATEVGKWKLCKNDLFNFVFEYPAEWTHWMRESTKGEFVGDYDEISEHPDALQKECSFFNILLSSGPNITNAQTMEVKAYPSWARENNTKLQAMFEAATTLEGLMSSLGDTEFLKSEANEINLRHGDTLYVIRFSNSVDDTNKKRILQTFKFIQAPTNENPWKVYRSEAYGFELSYPSSFEFIDRGYDFQVEGGSTPKAYKYNYLLSIRTLSGSYLDILIYNNITLNLDDFINTYFTYLPPYASQEMVTIGDKEMREFLNIGMERGRELFWVNTSSGRGVNFLIVPNDTENLEDFHKVIDSFKFVR